MTRKIILILISFNSCTISTDNNEKTIEEERISKISSNYFELTKKAFAGDTTAYKEIRELYNESTPGNFLYWSIVMSNKHNYSQAHLDVFYSITDDYIGGNLERFDEIDSQTQKLALSFLDKAVKANIPEAIDIKTKLKYGKLMSRD